MDEKRIRVETYSGFRADERPTTLYLSGTPVKVEEVEGKWYSPGATFFRVRLEGGERYVLRHEEGQNVWTLSAYRAGNR